MYHINRSKDKKKTISSPHKRKKRLLKKSTSPIFKFLVKLAIEILLLNISHIILQQTYKQYCTKWENLGSISSKVSNSFVLPLIFFSLISTNKFREKTGRLIRKEEIK